MIKNFNKYQVLYQKEVKDKHFGLLIYFPENDLKGLQKTGWVKYDFSHKRWLGTSDFNEKELVIK
jgi:hypothetical protein